MTNNQLVMLLRLGRFGSVKSWLDKLAQYLEDPEVQQQAYLHTRVFSFYPVNLLRYHNLQHEFGEGHAG